MFEYIFEMFGRPTALLITIYLFILIVIQRVRQLKSLCEELDNQIQDYEEMNRQYEQKESQWKQDRYTRLER